MSAIGGFAIDSLRAEAAKNERDLGELRALVLGRLSGGPAAHEHEGVMERLKALETGLRDLDTNLQREMRLVDESSERTSIAVDERLQQELRTTKDELLARTTWIRDHVIELLERVARLEERHPPGM